MSNRIVIIVGPTSAGKSELAVKIAKEINGEVISADSRQIYKFLNIGTGKITKREMKGIPHYILDIAHPRRTYSVEKYLKEALKKIKEILKKGKTPIICGGTGFYISAIIDGISIPSVPPNPLLRKKLEKKNTESLFKELKRKDSERAKTIDQKNRRRIIRALEIIEKMGKVPKVKKNPLEAEVLIIGIKKDPKELRCLIEKRLEERIKKGMIAEVKRLREKHNLSWQRLENLGLEYRWTARYLKNEITKNQLKEILSRKIWQYARRQMTWFRKDKRICWVKNYSEAKKCLTAKYKLR